MPATCINTGQKLTNQETFPGWFADLELEFSNRYGQTMLTCNRHTGPLRMQRLFHPEGLVCHAYILHPPGGIVGGDQLVTHATVKTDAATLITTPGAAKFYRSSGPEASQEQFLYVEQDAGLEWFPQENIVYPGANANVLTRIDLEGDAHYMGWDIWCLGMPACGQKFTFGRLNTVIDIRRDGEPLLMERFFADGEKDMNRPAGMRGFSVCATFTAANVQSDMIDELRQMMTVAPGTFAGLTLMDDILVARYLGHSSTEAKKMFQGLWTWLRPRISGREACAPRIWAT